MIVRCGCSPTQIIVTKLSKIWVGDPGSEIGILLPGSRGQKAPDPRSGSATLVNSDYERKKEELFNDIN